MQGHTVVPLPRELLYKKDLKKFLEKEQPDYIFHLASYGNKYDQTDENLIIKANINALINLLNASKNIPYKAFINFSSSSTLLEYETFYSATKGAGERLVKAHVFKYDKPIVTVRPFSVYGSGDDPKHFIPVAIKAFKENLELKVSPGEHDWIHISDLISGVWVVTQNILRLKGQAINVGTGRATLNYGIVSILRDIFDKSGNIKKIESMRSYDNENWVADIKVLKSLGWYPKMDLQEGLERLVYGNN